MAMATFQLFFSASAAQAAIIFFTSAEVRQGLVRIRHSNSGHCCNTARGSPCYGSRRAGAMSISGDPMISAKFRISVLAPLLAAALASTLAAAGARAEPRDDFLAGRTKACAGCDLTGANFKRRDLTG